MIEKLISPVRLLNAWGPIKALFGIGFTVVAVQGLSFISNIFVARGLSVYEYALLTSSLSILGVLSAIADSGVSQAALTVGGVHHHSINGKAEVLRLSLAKIRNTSLIGLGIIIPIWVWMVSRLQAELGSIFLSGFVLFGGFIFLCQMNVFKSMLLLENFRVFIQKMEVSKTLIRVILLVAGLSIFPNAAFVIVCGSVVEFWCWHRFKYKLQDLASTVPSDASEVIKSEINRVVTRMMPAIIYRAVSSQIFLLLLIGLGSASHVAGAGALGKLQQCFVIIPSVVVMGLSPRLARIKELRKRNVVLMQSVGIGFFGALFVWAVLVLFAVPILHLFGTNYEHLVMEMRIFVTGACFFTMTGVCGALSNVRGWVIPPKLFIGSDILFSIFAITTGNPSTLQGFVKMNCVLSGGALITFLGWIIFCLIYRRETLIA